MLLTTTMLACGPTFSGPAGFLLMAVLVAIEYCPITLAAALSPVLVVMALKNLA